MFAFLLMAVLILAGVEFAQFYFRWLERQDIRDKKADRDARRDTRAQEPGS